MKRKKRTEVESFFRNADTSWWNPDCGHDNRFWIFKAQSEFIRTQLILHESKSVGIQALDAGCGRGIHSRLLRDLGYTVTSLDINPKMLTLTGSITDSTLVDGSLVDMPFDDASFNVVVSIGTSMHVPSVDELMSEIHRVLIPNGIAAMSMANKLSLYAAWTTRINDTLADHQKLYHRVQFPSCGFRKLLMERGFEIINSKGFAVVPPISLKREWRQNIVNPFASKLLSWPFDWILGRHFGCGVTFMVRKT